MDLFSLLAGVVLTLAAGCVAIVWYAIHELKKQRRRYK